MTHEKIRDLLQDYLDEQLDPETSRAVKEHLEDCPSCRRECDQTRELLRRAAGLTGEIQPSGDLWPGIARGVEEDASRGKILSFPWRGSRLIAPSLVAAAAAVLIVMAVGRQMSPHGRSATLPGGLHIEMPEDSDPTAFATIETLEAQCRQGDAGVQSLAEGNPERGEGVTAILDNLTTIDMAIDQAKKAWCADPKSSHLARMLIAAYRAKVSLQGRAAEIALKS